MKSSRALFLLALAGCGLCLLFYYVPTSIGHTITVARWRPLGLWQIRSPGGLALFYALLLAGLFTVYLLGARQFRAALSKDFFRRGIVYAGAAVMLLTLTFTPSLLSKDVFDYAVQGRILALHRANPFLTPAAAFPSDPFIEAMGWPDFTTLYGPGWVSACGVLAFVSPGTPQGAAIFFKIVFGLLHLLNGALIAALVRPRSERAAAKAEFLYLWNPLLLMQTSAQAHNDVFLMLWVLLGLVFLSRRDLFRGFYETALGVVCLTVSVLVKYVTAPILALCLAVSARRSSPGGGPGRAALLSSIAGAVFILGYLPYAAGMEPLHFLRPYQMGNYQGGALMIVDVVAGKILGGAGSEEARHAAAPFMRALSFGLTLALALFGGVLLTRARRMEQVPRLALTILMAYLIGVTALLRVSYGVWIVPLALLIREGLLRRAVLLMSASLFALEIYWVYALRSMGSSSSTHREQILASAVAVGAPFFYLLAGLIRRRRRAPVPGAA